MFDCNDECAQYGSMLTVFFFLFYRVCRYVIAKQVTGQKISFRFEMASSSEKQETHMMVTRGRFKQIKPPPLVSRFVFFVFLFFFALFIDLVTDKVQPLSRKHAAGVGTNEGQHAQDGA